MLIKTQIPNQKAEIVRLRPDPDPEVLTRLGAIARSRGSADTIIVATHRGRLVEVEDAHHKPGFWYIRILPEVDLDGIPYAPIPAYYSPAIGANGGVKFYYSTVAHIDALKNAWVFRPADWLCYILPESDWEFTINKDRQWIK